MSWDKLTQEQKNKYKEFCDNHYGKTIVSSVTGEPLYLDENGQMIDTDFIIKLMFFISAN